MAVNSETSRVQYAGNNSTSTAYTVPFRFLENSHLYGIATTAAGVESAVTLANHTGAGAASGGTVTTTAAVPTTSTLTIYRLVPTTQETSYEEGGDFPAASHERALDKLTMVAQQNARSFGRGIRVSEATGELDEITAVPNSVLGLTSAGQPKAMTLAEFKTYLGLTGVTLDVDAGMKTAADSGERGLAVPDYVGQLLTQRDTAAIYVATGTSAGNWAAVTVGITLASLASGFFTADTTGRGKFADGFLDSTRLAANAVSTAKLADAAVTLAKLEAAVQGALVPVGAVMPFAMNSDPSGWIHCDGAAVSRTITYAALFAAIGTTYGAGNGSTTFNLPDLRGYFVRGFGTNGDGTASDTFGAKQADEFKAHTHQVRNFTTTTTPGGAVSVRVIQTGENYVASGSNGGTETRPKNIAMRYCIKF
jgi:microcystin-dependent protein